MINFQRCNLCQTPPVTLCTAKARTQEISQQFGSQLVPNDPRTKAEHVHVVVLHTLPRGKGIMTHAGANTAKLVRRHRSTHAAATHNYAPIRATVQHRSRHRGGAVGVVVARLDGGRPAIHNCMLQSHQLAHDSIAQGPTGVVGSERYSHWCSGVTGAISTPATTAFQTLLEISAMSCCATFSLGILRVSTTSTYGV